MLLMQLGILSLFNSFSLSQPLASKLADTTGLSRIPSIRLWFSQGQVVWYMNCWPSGWAQVVLHPLKSMGKTGNTVSFTVYGFFATFVWNFCSFQSVLKSEGLRNLPCHRLSHSCWFGFCFLHFNFSWNSVNPQVCHTTLLSLHLMLVSCSFFSLFPKGLGLFASYEDAECFLKSFIRFL